jgi:POT family proton-dependent oligopeptide transporter
MNLLSRKSFLAMRMPNGFGSLFFTQLFSTISFAVLYATLVLYMKEQLHLSSAEADLITGVYFACNFALHLLSGYLDGRFFSYRGLVVTGIIFQLIGCVILSNGTMQSLYWGLACMLVGTGTMVTCLNMLLSQLYTENQSQKRETGFLWNCSGMNLGFILGFTLAGYYQLHVNYTMLFLITAANNVLALVILLARWIFNGGATNSAALEKFMHGIDIIKRGCRGCFIQLFFKLCVG